MLAHSLAWMKGSSHLWLRAVLPIMSGKVWQQEAAGRHAVHTQEAEDSASQLGHLEGTRGKENLAISSLPIVPLISP